MGNSNANNHTDKKWKFCDIINSNQEGVILYQDEHIVMFSDIKPSAQIHIQIVPKTHIKNINHLKKDYVELLVHMKEKAIYFMNSNYSENENFAISNI
jgi:diadenosine tetraphosphate (Ap4A) HIT family hydrolase